MALSSPRLAVPVSKKKSRTRTLGPGLVWSWNFAFPGTEVGKRRPAADVGGLGTPRGDPDTAQDASQVGPRRLHIPFGRPSETVGDLSTPGLVTTAGVSVTVAPDTAGPGNRYRGVWARDAADAAGLGNGYQGSG